MCTSGSAINFLLESDNFSVVLVGSSWEVLLNLSQFFVQIVNKFVDGVQQLLEGTLSLEVNLGEVNDPTSPLWGLDLSQWLFLLLGEHACVNGKSWNAKSEDQQGSFHFF